MQRAPVFVSAVAVAVAVAATACAPAAPPQFPARPPNCALETYKVRPQRPYIELETFNLYSTATLQDVLRKIRERACRDGADAIYAPKTGKVYSYAIALKWRDAPPPPASPPPASPPPAPPPPASPPPASPPPASPPPASPPSASSPAR